MTGNDDEGGREEKKIEESLDEFDDAERESSEL